MSPAGLDGRFYVRVVGRGPSRARIRPGDHPLVNTTPCLACGSIFTRGDSTVLIVLGPGGDEEARTKCADGRFYDFALARSIR